jgi:hypothetical protein
MTSLRSTKKQLYNRLKQEQEESEWAVQIVRTLRLRKNNRS